MCRIISILLLLPVIAQAETIVYQWIDPDGVVCFSQIPPDHENYTVHRLRSGISLAVPRLSSSGPPRRDQRAGRTGAKGKRNLKRRCAALKRQIEAVRDRQRAGYRAGQGVRLDEQLRRLKQDWFGTCH